jgi:NADH-quinone oxidoreductase subunit J
MLIIFIFFSLLTIGSALFILFTKNVIHAAFALLTAFLGIAALFVFAGADFMAVSQIVIYIGGVLVLILFGIMISKRMPGKSSSVVTENKRIKRASIAGFVLFAILCYGIKESEFSELSRLRNQEMLGGSTLKTIGENLMTDFVLPFEVSALLLMAALMGAAFIAGRLVKK